jgi:hypothetical protein
VRHRDLIIARAGQHKLPAVYYDRYFVTAGGLISYGPDLVDQYRQAASWPRSAARRRRGRSLRARSRACAYGASACRRAWLEPDERRREDESETHLIHRSGVFPHDALAPALRKDG